MGHQAQLDRIEAMLAVVLRLLNQQGKILMSTVADLTAAVAAEQTVVSSAVTLINGLVAQLAAAQAAGNQAAFDACVSAIQAQTSSLAAAVQAGTPAAPPAAS